MRSLYLECNMGAAGDMLMAALWELIGDKQAFLDRMNGMGLPGVKLNALRDTKCGIVGTRMQVTVDGQEEESLDHPAHHHDHDHDHGHAHYCHEEEPRAHHGEHAHVHAGMEDVRQKIESLALPEKVRADVLGVYRLIAEAESRAHDRPVEEIHFHEVGTADAIADIAGVCLLMEEIAPDRVFASPVHVGCGQVRCAHGILPVPAPATAYLLRGIPSYGGAVQGELCTPTGAALLKYFVTEFGNMPVMSVRKIGYGMGKKDFEQANCVRAMLGETDEDRQQILELCCNLDDMTPEAVGFAQEQLFAAGALDVYTIPIGMKKSRPGVLLTCMCRLQEREAMLHLIFKHTTTLGIRENICNRYTLNRRERKVQTPYGSVRFKEAEGFGVRREKPEYEDMAKIAREQEKSLGEVKTLIDGSSKIC